MRDSGTIHVGHDEVAGILACEIISGQRPQGSRMPSVEEMFDRFGVSRVMMREVTKTLTAKGLVAAKSRVGTLVLPPERWAWFDVDLLSWRVRVGLDAAFMDQLTQMRRAVEPAAAALAAERASPAQIDEMRAALDAMAAAGVNRHAFAQADLRFHVALGAASGNPLFRSFASVVETALDASLSLTAPPGADTIATIVRRHRDVADAVAAGDAAGAARAMLTVIDEGVQWLRRDGASARPA
ncbi:FCD domain-containing protein [Sphingomonas sp. A2-49]|uniref:FadR/GntR family transcriptional regulator n=1 Tax=Sphingomonas sp. A2-49 TaxID=1391375 RepID=UPI0021CEBA73|nr:FCD domain-containing protein [Sphingomonas sp. A2-49]MCU6453746.1 FCD domain-containing protein [Sphingomonas sp. A2-49]